MRRTRSSPDSRMEIAVHELLDSRAESRIYVFLLRNKGARSDDIIRGTHLHPSTVREFLSKMYTRKIIFRKKIRTENIGKNPYLYYAVSPVVLLQRRVKILEMRLNKIAQFTCEPHEVASIVQITIDQKEADQ
ncbi:MAG TPA: helix-turn-helix domain-containing protein [Candidatus Thermoplasmatota archaeon]|nr:helix-turn-helix domain-containing protein [Candidatus Thermoplasmatota archaeon]